MLLYLLKCFNNRFKMVYKILIEPAKSDKSTCKNCRQKIEKNSLRAKVVDATEFNAYI